MRIRKISKEDIKGVSRVYVDSWRTTYRSLVPDDYLDELSYEDTEKRWIDFLNNENEELHEVHAENTGELVRIIN
ncbi:hypothetical protein [Bacillus fungorum]|uniref:hypothetical protein n=1 Tax=Bacillus fungorum TaxID=2039284 RepID=UPI001FE564FF|nr:hypothetical protein [Bacillus fungorum]